MNENEPIYKSVREVVLEQELAYVRRELDYYRHKYGDASAISNFAGRPVEVVSLNDDVDTLTVAAQWKVEESDRHIPRHRHIIGELWDKSKGLYVHKYFVSHEVLMRTTDLLGTLGKLHENVIHSLAKEYTKAREDRP